MKGKDVNTCHTYLVMEWLPRWCTKEYFNRSSCLSFVICLDHSRHIWRQSLIDISRSVCHHQDWLKDATRVNDILRERISVFDLMTSLIPRIWTENSLLGNRRSGLLIILRIFFQSFWNKSSVHLCLLGTYCQNRGHPIGHAASAPNLGKVWYPASECPDTTFRNDQLTMNRILAAHS